MTRFAMLGGLLLTLAAFAAADDKKDEKKAAATPLEGSWKVVEASVDGKAEPKEKLPNMVFTFEGSKLTIAEGNRKPDAGSFTVDLKKEPAHIDMHPPKDEKGAPKGTVAGIYKLDKDGKLTLAFSRGKDAARPKSFDGKDAVVLVLEKVKK
jgi:uncharacterized protein (TIGR03067 family)